MIGLSFEDQVFIIGILLIVLGVGFGCGFWWGSSMVETPLAGDIEIAPQIIKPSTEGNIYLKEDGKYDIKDARSVIIDTCDTLEEARICLKQYRKISAEYDNIQSMTRKLVE